ncbi:MAG: VCBS repeat-containing protein [Deltaproteobacteria bacterium]|nr:VCBS repeat-containing protein [Deltaproteobacteria bacterium]
MTPVLLALSLVGCNEPVEEYAQPVEWVDLTEAVGVEISGAVGAAPQAAVVRAVNAYGIPVPADTATVIVDGVNRVIPLDAWGYGEVRLDAPGTSQVSAGGETVSVHALATSLPLGLDPAQEAPLMGNKAVHLTGGVVVSDAHALWYASPDMAPHRVLQFDDFEIEDVKAAHLNGDGLLDAVVWGGDIGVLLLGRPGGGVSLGGALRAPGAFVGGMEAGDLDKDGLPDLLVGFQDAVNGHFFEVMWGEGVGRFGLTEPTGLFGKPVSAGLGDNAAAGAPQVTFLVEELSGAVGWERYEDTEKTEGGFVPIGPVIDLDFPLGSTVDASHDINTDGGEQVVVFGPPVEQGTRQFWAYDLADNNPQYLRLETDVGFFDFGDADGDGFAELWMLQQGKGLVMLGQEDGSYRQKRVADGIPHGVIAVPDLNGDRWPDLFVGGGERWSWWTGFRDEEDPEAAWWQPMLPAGASKGVLDLSGPVVGADGAAVAGVIQSRKLYLARMVRDEVGQVLVEKQLLLTGAEQLLDLDLCDGVLWALTEDGLVRVPEDLGGSESLTPDSAVTGERVACGYGPSGASAAVLRGTSGQLLTNAGNPSGGAFSLGGAYDLALSGGATHTCLVEGCSVVGWAGGVVRSDADGTVWTQGGVEVTLSGFGGAASVADVDGDGAEDLLVGIAGGVLVARQSPDGVGPAELLHAGEYPLSGQVAVTDSDGDGALELWFGDGSDGLWSCR